MSFCSLTFTTTSTSSLVPSGYVTSTVPGWSPFSVVDGAPFFHSILVFGGNLSIFPMLFLASGSVPLSTVCWSGVGLFFSLIEYIVIFAVFSLIFPALSSTRIVSENSFDCIPIGSFSTSCLPALNLIEFVVLSYSK